MALKTNKTMKATNIFQSLKAQGVCGTDGMPPKLPGLKSPLKKSPYKFNAGLKKAAAEGKLDNNPKFKDAVESSPAKLAPVVAAVGKKALVGVAKKMIAKKAAEKASPAKKYKSDAQRKAVHASKAEQKSPVKKKYCSSPAKKKVDGKPKKEVKAKSITYDPVSKTTTRTFSDADVKKYGVKKQIVTKAKPKSPAKKKSCGSPVKMDIEGRKPKTRRNKAQRRVNKMLGGLANANRGCKPHRKIKSR